MRILAAVLTCAVLLGGCFAGTPVQTASLAKIPRVEKAPALEDFLSMHPSPEWQGKLAMVDDFRQFRPGDGTPASQRTIAYLGYDQKSLYVIFVCFDDPEKVRAHLTRREQAFDDDFVDVWLDTFHDRRRGYEFLVNPLGVQHDGIVLDNSEDFSFDTVWQSRGKLTTQGYVVWIAIPFKSLRFSNAAVQTWGISLQRDIKRNNEKSFWPLTSQRISGILVQSAEMRGLERISPGRNLQFIPYGLYRGFRELDLRDPSAPRFSARSAKVDGGLDAKIIAKDKLVFDFTVEPDFSQIESDEPQVTVSQRFEVFFPEKRPFFQENASYFTTPIDLFFTRRIANPQFGARMTGKVGRYSVAGLVADDRGPGQVVAPGDPMFDKRAYFAIARVSRDLFKDSALGVMFTNREFEGSFNRVGGIDGRFKLSKSVTTSFQAVESATRRLDGSYLAGPAFEGDLTRNGRDFYANFHYTGRSDGFRTLSGFDPQPDVHLLNASAGYLLWPKGRKILNYGPEMRVYRFFDHEGNRTGWGYMPALNAEFARQTQVMLLYAQEAELLRPRDFSALTSNVNFVRQTKELYVRSGYFRQATVTIDYRWGRRINYVAPTGTPPYLARRNSLDLTLGLRPINRLQVDNTYLYFRLGDVNTRRAAFNNHIIRSKFNYQFTRELAARVIVQYNAILANPALTSLATSKSVNCDFLVSYLLHPGTAVYVGYNSNLQNYDPSLALGPDGLLLRTRNRFLNDSRQFFVKVSYLLRF